MNKHSRHAVRGVAVATALILSACSTGGGATTDTGSDTLPDTIGLVGVQDLSGTSGPGGQATERGMQIAIDYANEADILGGSTLELEIQDSATDPAKAANAMNKIVTGDAPLAFGSFTSTSALAEAPIAQRAGVPTIFTQAGAEGVLEAGDHIFRATPLQTSYFDLTLKYLQDQAVTTAAMIQDTDIPTLIDLGEAFEEGESEYGYEVVSKQTTTSSTVDVSSQISKILREDPDAIFVNVLLGHNVQVIKQLKQAGYTGTIVAQQGAGGGVLAPLGAQANGVVLATDFNPESGGEVTREFVERYTAEYGEAPGNFSAEGFDAVLLAAYALEKAGSTRRNDVLAAMNEVASEGYEGALGEITFDGRQQLAPGVLVELKGGKEVPVQ